MSLIFHQTQLKKPGNGNRKNLKFQKKLIYMISLITYIMIKLLHNLLIFNF